MTDVPRNVRAEWSCLCLLYKYHWKPFITYTTDPVSYVVYSRNVIKLVFIYECDQIDSFPFQICDSNKNTYQRISKYLWTFYRTSTFLMFHIELFHHFSTFWMPIVAQYTPINLKKNLSSYKNVVIKYLIRFLIPLTTNYVRFTTSQRSSLFIKKYSGIDTAVVYDVEQQTLKHTNSLIFLVKCQKLNILSWTCRISKVWSFF